MKPGATEATAINALSARVIALETLVNTLILHTTIDRTAAFDTYDALGEYLADCYVGEPLAEQRIKPLQQSFADLRSVLLPVIPGVLGTAAREFVEAGNKAPESSIRKSANWHSRARRRS